MSSKEAGNVMSDIKYKDIAMEPNVQTHRDTPAVSSGVMCGINNAIALSHYSLGCKKLPFSSISVVTVGEHKFSS